MKSVEIVSVRRYASLELLRAIAIYAPQEISLSNLTLRPDQPLELRGTSAGSAAVAGLQHALGLSPLVRRASITGIERVAGRTPAADRLNFSMQLHLWTEKEAEPRAVSLRRERGGA
jgi:hypothetical protein